MKTTLNKILAHKPCEVSWEKLLANLDKTKADDEPLSIKTIIENNGIEDAIWCLRAVDGHDREIRLYAVWCARQVQHLMTDPRSLEALDVAEAFANGSATNDALAAAGAAAGAAWAADGRAARNAAWAAAWAFAGDAARAAGAAGAAAGDVLAARAAVMDAQKTKLIELCDEVDAREAIAKVEEA